MFCRDGPFLQMIVGTPPQSARRLFNAWKPTVLFDWKHAEPVAPLATVSLDPLALVCDEVTLPAADPVFTLTVTCVKPDGHAPPVPGAGVGFGAGVVAAVTGNTARYAW